MDAFTIDSSSAMAHVAAAIADVTRSTILCALMDGRALAAGELAITAGVSAQNASNHLQALLSAGLVRVHRQGRHRYYSLTSAHVAQAIESLLVIAGPKTTAKSPSRPASSHPWAFARTCYDHAAGALAVAMTRGLLEQSVLVEVNDAYELGPSSDHWLHQIDLSAAEIRAQRRAFARQCMDWTERRPHIGGALGAALLQKLLELDWLRRDKASRVLTLSAEGERQIRRLFRIDIAAIRKVRHA